jgi:dipeptidyl aminopeptidase/acylaminoacyl peptidase
LFALPETKSDVRKRADVASAPAQRSRAWIAAATCMVAAALAALQGDIDTRDAVITEGIPATPPRLRAQLDPYFRFGAARLAGWHPTRREMLVKSGGQLFQVPAPGRRVRRLTFSPDPVGMGSYSPLTGDCVIFSRDRNGDERYQLYRCDVETRRTTLLTEWGTRLISAVWNLTGSRMACLSEREDGTRQEVYLLDPYHPPSRQHITFLAGQRWSIRHWSPDDRQLLLHDYRSGRESYLWLLDVATGEMSLLTPPERHRKIGYGQSAFSRDGMGVYTLTDRDSQHFRLAYIDLLTKRHYTLTDHLLRDVEEFALAQDGRWIAFVTRENGISSLRLMETEGHQEVSGGIEMDGEISGIGWHSDSRHLGFTFEAPRYPMDACSLDTDAGKPERWTDSHHRTLPEAKFSEPHLIQWRSFDGRSISGWLYRPPKRFRGRRPVIIEIHGGPVSQSRPEHLGRSNYYLNELGVALLYPNVRGSWGYGKTFLTLDDGMRREDAVKDLGALLDWIRTQPDLDPDRVMVSGGSYGGYLALSAAASYNDRIRCTVARFAPSNLVTLLETAAGGAESRPEYGDERDPRVRACLERIAPVHNAHRIRKPVLLIHGDNDPRVPVSESEQMAAALRRNGTPLWYLRARNEGHGFYHRRAYRASFEGTVLFVKRYLLP